jgi:hypothetical protein
MTRSAGTTAATFGRERKSQRSANKKVADDDTETKDYVAVNVDKVTIFVS